jgi:hypothetical protein
VGAVAVLRCIADLPRIEVNVANLLDRLTTMPK